MQNNKDTHFILYKSANTQKGIQRAQAHTGADDSRFATLQDFEELQKQNQNCHLFTMIDNAIQCAKYQLGGIDKNAEFLTISQSGYVATVFAENLNIVSTDKISEKCKNRVSETIRQAKAPAKFSSCLDTTPSITIEQFEKIVESFLEEGKQLKCYVAVDVLPELYTKEQ